MEKELKKKKTTNIQTNFVCTTKTAEENINKNIEEKNYTQTDRWIWSYQNYIYKMHKVDVQQ